MLALNEGTRVVKCQPWKPEIRSLRKRRHFASDEFLNLVSPMMFKLQMPAWVDTTLHLNPAEKEVMENSGLLLNKDPEAR